MQGQAYHFLHLLDLLTCYNSLHPGSDKELKLAVKLEYRRQQQ